MNRRLLLSYFLLAAAVLGNNGGFFPLLMPLLLASFYLLIQAVAEKALPCPAKSLAWLLALEWLLALPRPLGASPRPLGWLALYFLLTAALLLCALHACLHPVRAPRRWAALLLLLSALSGLVVLRISPVPHIDVFVIQQQGAADLLAGRNPYTATFPNIYDARDTAAFFGAQVPVLTHYPYPPLSLYVTAIARALGRDVRLAYWLLQGLSGLGLFLLAEGAGRPPWYTLGLLGLYLLHPRGTYVLEQSWTEPLIICALVFLLLATQARARPWVRVLLLGAFLAAKQYSVLALPLLALAGWSLPLLLGGAALAGLVSVPMLLWDVPAFIDDVVLFQLRQPFREDALSLPAAVAWLSGWRAPGALALVGGGAALWWLHRRRPPLPRGAALLYFSFFLTAKQAFCNYYYMVGVLLLCAAATSPDRDGGAHDGRADVSLLW